MKRKFTMALVAVAAMFALSNNANAVDRTGELVIAKGLRFNESACPYDGGVLVANFGGEVRQARNRDGLGYISMFKDGELSTFIPADGSLSAPKGMVVKDGYLLVCDVTELVVYNLNDIAAGAQVLHFPEGEIALNDITVNGDTLYVSVTNTGNIFTIDGSDLANIASAEPKLWYNVLGANGILMHDGTLYVCSYASTDIVAENVIYKITDLDSPAKEPLFTYFPSKWDGIAISEDGKTMYASCWVPAGIYAIDIATGIMAKIPFETELVSPADITIFDGKLYIPDMHTSRLIVKEL